MLPLSQYFRCVSMMLSKLSHQFPATEAIFVSQINKSTQTITPFRSKRRASPRHVWLHVAPDVTLQIKMLL
ncbi:TPA: hypothetical protein JD175_01425 [Cronobacter sakazakii]|nr:hypothetical protein [Cronobacter sakazakii]RHW63556.1 hypothetical protein AUM81_06155 [Cronobacter sakazakii]HAU5436970.1 hypothetical protein [Cronobacter sakazakii]HAU5484018.1 hypothetical protein [Cronobacter sakazakii]